MDLKQLLENHEAASQNARRAMRMQDRETYFDLAGHYARRIAAFQRDNGPVAAAGLDERHPDHN